MTTSAMVPNFRFFMVFSFHRGVADTKSMLQNGNHAVCNGYQEQRINA
jgi:hypothetical protein